MIDFHPSMVRLIDLGDELLAGEEEGGACRQALQACLALNEEERRRFSLSVQGVAVMPETERLAAEIRRLFEDRAGALDRLAKALPDPDGEAPPDSDAEPFEKAPLDKEPLEKALLEVCELSMALYRAGSALYGEDRKHHVTPFPAVQDFLQAGRNVLKSGEPPEALAIRVPIMEHFMAGCRRTFEEDCEAHPRFTAYRDDMMKAFALLEEGVAAARSSGLTELSRGLELLEEGARKMEEVTREIRKYLRDLTGYSSLTPIALLAERWRRLAGGDVSREAYEQAVEGARRLVELHGRSIEVLRESLAPEAVLEELTRYHESELEALDGLTSEEPPIERFKTAAEFFDDAYRDGLAALKEGRPDLTQAPNILYMRAVVEGLRRGRVPRRAFRDAVKSLAALVDDALGGELTPSHRHALTRQREGLSDLASLDPRGEHGPLVEAMKKLEEGAAMLLEEMGSHAAPDRAGAAVPCMRCGEMNEAGVKHCVKCGAYLALSKDTTQKAPPGSGGAGGQNL